MKCQGITLAYFTIIAQNIHATVIITHWHRCSPSLHLLHHLLLSRLPRHPLIPSLPLRSFLKPRAVVR